MLAEKSHHEHGLLMFSQTQFPVPSPENMTRTGITSPDSTHTEPSYLAVVVADALIARDVAIQQLQTACVSIREKELLIANLEHEKMEQLIISDMNHLEIDETRKAALVKERADLMNKISELEQAKANLTQQLQDVMDSQKNDFKRNVVSPALSPNPGSISGTPRIPVKDDHEERLHARYAVLSELPIPPDMPSDILFPIIIPPPFTIHDFIGTITGSLKAQLANYRIFQEYTTSWCPDREEHGYYLSPVFKCMTNPRTPTAHRWVMADLAAQMNHPMECFYNKEGKWYYAGVYKSFRLDDLSVSEWDKLTTEASQAVIKDTLTHRKNTSPQNVYETGQLYAAGALKVACIGLQCVGFDNTLYKGLLEQAETCKRNGRWRAPPTAGLGTAAGLWNVNANNGLKAALVNAVSLGAKTG